MIEPLDSVGDELDYWLPRLAEPSFVYVDRGMSVAFGNVIFDLVDYDQDVDVLYLSTSGVTPCEREESPEGHILRFDENGVICGITIIGVSRFLDAEDKSQQDEAPVKISLRET